MSTFNDYYTKFMLSYITWSSTCKIRETVTPKFTTLCMMLIVFLQIDIFWKENSKEIGVKQYNFTAFLCCLVPNNYGVLVCVPSCLPQALWCAWHPCVTCPTSLHSSIHLYICTYRPGSWHPPPLLLKSDFLALFTSFFFVKSIFY